MHGSIGFISFIESYKDLINIIVGIIGGIFLSTVTFLLTYRNSWRNRLTRELTVKLKFSSKKAQGESVKELNLFYEINNTNGVELSINSAYLELPEKIQGNPHYNSPLGEQLFGTGKYHIFQENKLMTHHLADKISLNDLTILKNLFDQKRRKLRLVISTSRYGIVKSNFLKI